jgi:oligoendopeptidase F
MEGRLNESPATLFEALQAQSEILRRLARLYVHAALKADEDLRIAANLERREAASALLSAYSEATSWTAAELIAIGASRVEQMTAAEPRLEIFRHRLDDILRMAPHTLDPQREALLASAGSANNSSPRTYRGRRSSCPMDPSYLTCRVISNCGRMRRVPSAPGLTNCSIQR